MKKPTHFSTVLLAAAMLLSLLASCGGTPGASGMPSTSPSSETPTSPSESEPQPSQIGTGGGAGIGKTLVVYYSATGSTEAVAGYIANATGGDTFAITPTEPYSSDDLNWRDSNSRVSREHDDPALRTMELTETAVDGWEDYDTVFIGYPIWWGIAAWPVNDFVKNNDFTGKTVIPFCTSTSSGLGQSGELLKEMAVTGNWQEGRRFSERASQSDITAWINSLDLPQADTQPAQSVHEMTE